jgi:hypothetical protein
LGVEEDMALYCDGVDRDKVIFQTREREMGIVRLQSVRRYER